MLARSLLARSTLSASRAFSLSVPARHLPGWVPETDWKVGNDVQTQEKRSRSEQAAQMFQEQGSMPSEITHNLGAGRPLSITTVRKYLLERALVDKPFYDYLRDPTVWQRFVQEQGTYSDCEDVDTAIELRRKFEHLDNVRDGSGRKHQGSKLREFHVRGSKYD